MFLVLALVFYRTPFLFFSFFPGARPIFESSVLLLTYRGEKPNAPVEFQCLFTCQFQGNKPPLVGKKQPLKNFPVLILAGVDQLNVRADPCLPKSALKLETTLEPLFFFIIPAAGHNQLAPGDKSCVSKPRHSRDFNNVKKCDETLHINQQPPVGRSLENIKPPF